MTTKTAKQIQSGNESIIRIPDLDAHIYRIFPFWFFEEVLRLKQLALVRPNLWEDPFETLPCLTMMVDRRSNPYRKELLDKYLQPAYAQCWSKTEESDTLLRAYSRVTIDSHSKRNTDPKHEGVRVRSSSLRLISAIQNWAESNPNVSCFIGAVQYRSGEKIQQYLVNLIDQEGAVAVGAGRNRAELMLQKRAAFSHENEVRLICVGNRETHISDIIKITIEPNEIFDEVTFDPRLQAFEKKEREIAIRRLGYEGLFKETDLYQGTLLELILPNGWE